ncbi:hypothetical protein FJZ55_05760, partial [Candidatus Woesearchaeota archaeon]|nr:hypothetical protein [Candidatus Woesearchaeota archaeon]
DRNGNITAIGGLPYKLEGCKKSGVKYVFIPKENEKDINDILTKNKSLFNDNFKYKLIDNIRQVLDYALIESDGIIDEPNKITYEKTFSSVNYLGDMKHIKLEKLLDESDISISSDDSSNSDETTSSSYSSDKTK